jgi:hypothetical protein
MFLDLDNAAVTSGALVVLKDLLRHGSSAAAAAAAALVARLASLTSADVQAEDGEARAALVWMFGEFGAKLDNAPYAIQWGVTRVGASVVIPAASLPAAMCWSR